MIRELTEAEAWLEIIAHETELLESGDNEYLCNDVRRLSRQMRLADETRGTMLNRINLFAPSAEYLGGAYWIPGGDDLAERVLAACFCLAMCEAGEAA
jgi:hypothetical protein